MCFKPYYCITCHFISSFAQWTSGILCDALWQYGNHYCFAITWRNCIFICSQSLLVRPRQIEVPFMFKVQYVRAPNYELSKIYTPGMEQYHQFYGDNISNSIFLQVRLGATFALSLSVATLEAIKEKMSVKSLRWCKKKKQKQKNLYLRILQ